eukprot:scaffold42495_cov32-Tisochrysis_lutea.AAC.2
MAGMLVCAPSRACLALWFACTWVGGVLCKRVVRLRGVCHDLITRPGGVDGGREEGDDARSMTL